MRFDPPPHHVDLPRDEDRALAVAQDLALALHRGEASGKGFRLLAAYAEKLREPPLVERDRFLFQRLQDELATRQRLGVALGFARALRIGRPSRRRRSRGGAGATALN